MRILVLILAAALAVTPALAAEVSVSRQTVELTTMFGAPPPAGATKLDDPGGETWLFEQEGRLKLTAKTKSLTGWATFELGVFDGWRVVGPGKGGKGVVLDVEQDGRARTLTLDLKRLHEQSKLKFTLQ